MNEKIKSLGCRNPVSRLEFFLTEVFDLVETLIR